MADDPGMDVDEDDIETPSSSNTKGDRKRFEVKKVIIIFQALKEIANYLVFILVECSCSLGLG